MFVGSGDHKAMRNPGSNIDTDMRHHTEVPLTTLLGLMHLGIALTGFVHGEVGPLINNACISGRNSVDFSKSVIENKEKS